MTIATLNPYDDRAFALLREYFTATDNNLTAQDVEEGFTDKILGIMREAAIGSFSEFLERACEWKRQLNLPF